MGNFSRGTNMTEILEKAEERPGIKYQYVGNYERTRNRKANAIISSLAVDNTEREDKFIIIEKKLLK